MYKTTSKQAAAAPRKKVFEDVTCGTIYLPSDWKKMRSLIPKKSIECQTPKELYNLQENEIQTGRFTNSFQNEIPKGIEKNITLNDYMEKNTNVFTPPQLYMKKKKSTSTTTTMTTTDAINWKQQIEDGFVSIDWEPENNPETIIQEEMIIEYVDVKKNVSCQTEKITENLVTSSATPSSGKNGIEEKGGSGAGGEEGKDSNLDDQQLTLPFHDYLPIHQPQQLLSFLDRVTPMIYKTLEGNIRSKAFENYSFESDKSLNISSGTNITYLTSNEFEGNNNNNNNPEDLLNKISLWRYLTVDLEKKKIIFPDWTKSKHFPGMIMKVTTTRNKERVYDIEYEDGIKYYGVREEYIRLLDNSNNVKINKKGNEKRLNIRYFEGMRVHCKVNMKSMGSKYMLSRVIKVNKNSLDVEILELGRIENSVSFDDIVLGGLSEGQNVEARKPEKIILQTTSVTWNANGSMIGVTYGKNDINGWCDIPGALCCWNIFAKTFNLLAPDVVIDHSSSLMCCSFHPLIPSIVAFGSYNGEILLYDLLGTLDKPLAISPVIEYSHKEPILDIKWVRNSRSNDISSGGGNLNDLEAWNVISCGCDGKILFWSISNKFQNPVKGYLLSKGKVSRRQFPVSNGATSISLSCNSFLMNNNSTLNRENFLPKWMVIGEAGGEIVRCQLNRLPNQYLSPETLKSLPAVSEVFPSLKRNEDAFAHQSHIGAVSCIDWSPFQRNLFLTGGVDGTVKLFHVLEQAPLLKWEPGATHQQDSIRFTSITAVRFSPHRPMVFAVGTNEGFVYIYDLIENKKLPVAILEMSEKLLTLLPTDQQEQLQQKGSAGSTALQNSEKSKGVGKKSTADVAGGGKNSVLSVAFNHKQRDLLAASDFFGKVFIWKLNWKLSNRRSDEIDLLNNQANIFSSDTK